jgi:hypothetical protein
MEDENRCREHKNSSVSKIWKIMYEEESLNRSQMDRKHKTIGI